MSYRSNMMLICTEDAYEKIKDPAGELGSTSWHYEDISYQMVRRPHVETATVHVMTWEQAPMGHNGAYHILRNLEEIKQADGLYRLLVNGESDDDAYIRANDGGYFDDYQIGFIYPHITNKQVIRFGDSQVTGIMNQIRELSEELLSYGSENYGRLTDVEREVIEECANMVETISAFQ